MLITAAVATLGRRFSTSRFHVVFRFQADLLAVLHVFALFHSCFWSHMDPSAWSEEYRLLILQPRPREGAKRLGQGQSAVDFSSDRKRAKKKKSPFSKE